MRYFETQVVVKTEALLNYELKTKAGNIFLDPEFDKDRNAHNSGIVVSVPRKLSNGIPFAMNQAGAPMYYDFDNREVIWLDRIPITLAPGDTCYYHHHAVSNALEKGIIKEEEEDGKKWYYIAIQYDLIFCGVRNGVIMPNATWTLVKPDMESWDDILIPIPEVDEFGQPKFEVKKVWDPNQNLFQMSRVPVWKPKELWIQRKVAPEHKYLLGYIHKAGEPIIGEEKDLQDGDHIVYRKHADFPVMIEGEKYFMIRQHHIEGKFL